MSGVTLVLIRGLALGAGLLAVLAPAVSAAPRAAPAPVLSAAAVHPGVAAPQTVTYDLARFVARNNVRVLRQPAADTVVLASPAVGEVRRNGHWTSARIKPCAQIRMRLSLHFDQPEPLSLVTQLSPVADLALYTAASGTIDPVGAKALPRVTALRADGRAVRKVGEVRTAAVVWDWRHLGRFGLSAMTLTSTAVRVTGDCRRQGLRLFTLLPEDRGVAGGA